MICKKCGNEIKEGEKFCSNCGYRITNEEVVNENKASSINKNKQRQPKNILGKITGQNKLQELQDLKERGVITEKEFKKSKNKLFIKICVIEVIILVLIPILVTGGVMVKQEIDKKIEKSKEVQVPNVIGKTISEAEQDLSTLDLRIFAENTNLTTLYSGSPDAIITTQKDEEGKILKKGDTVRVEAKTKEQIEKEKQEEEERKKKQEEAKAKGYRSSPATTDTIVSCAKTLISNNLKSPATAIWGKSEKVDEDNYGRCLVYVSVEAQNGFGGYIKSDYFVILQYVKSNGEFTYSPYSCMYELTTYGATSTYDYYVSTYKDGTVYPVIKTFLDNNGWNTRPKDV